MSADTPMPDYTESPLAESPGERPLLTLSELAYLAETTPGVIEQLLEWDVIVPAETDPEPCFPVETIRQVRRVLRLHAGLGVDFASLPLVLDLIRRIDDLERRLSDGDRPGSR